MKKILMLAREKSPYGSELLGNGDFNNGTTGWFAYQSTAANVSGQGVFTATANNDSRCTIQAVVEIGKNYIINADLIATDGTSVGMNYNENTPNQSVAFIPPGSVVSGSGSFTPIEFTATNLRCNVVFKATDLSIGETFTIDNVSVKEIL